MIYKITYQDVKTVKSVMRTDDDYKHMYLLEGQIAGFEKEWIDEDIGGIILFQTSNPHPKDLSKNPAVAGFFVSLHLSLHSSVRIYNKRK